MSDTTTLTVGDSFIRDGITRGAYLRLTGATLFAETTSGTANGGPYDPLLERVTHASPSVLTVRHAHTSRLVEWCHAKLEDWLLWPIADLRARTKASQ